MRSVQPGDAERLSVLLAKPDMVECAAFDMTPWQALNFGVRFSALAWTVTINEEPIAIMGVAPGEGDRGSPWLLVSTPGRKCRRAFLELGPQYVERMQQLFPELENWVWEGNTRAIRWLLWLGFTVDPDPVIFKRGVPMLHFRKGF